MNPAITLFPERTQKIYYRKNFVVVNSANDRSSSLQSNHTAQAALLSLHNTVKWLALGGQVAQQCPRQAPKQKTFTPGTPSTSSTAAGTECAESHLLSKTDHYSVQFLWPRPSRKVLALQKEFLLFKKSSDSRRECRWQTRTRYK